MGHRKARQCGRSHASSHTGRCSGSPSPHSKKSMFHVERPRADEQHRKTAASGRCLMTDENLNLARWITELVHHRPRRRFHVKRAMEPLKRPHAERV